VAFDIARGNKELLWLNGLCIEGKRAVDLAHYYPRGGLASYEAAFLIRRLQRVSFHDGMLRSIDLRGNRIGAAQVEKLRATCKQRGVALEVGEQSFYSY